MRGLWLDQNFFLHPWPEEWLEVVLGGNQLGNEIVSILNFLTEVLRLCVVSLNFWTRFWIVINISYNFTNFPILSLYLFWLWINKISHWNFPWNSPWHLNWIFSNLRRFWSFLFLFYTWKNHFFLRLSQFQRFYWRFGLRTTPRLNFRQYLSGWRLRITLKPSRQKLFQVIRLIWCFWYFVKWQNFHLQIFIYGWQNSESVGLLVIEFFQSQGRWKVELLLEFFETFVETLLLMVLRVKI